MPRDSAPTKARILAAATDEFAAHGLAGARIDRIAEKAEANKQLIYRYFDNKEALLDRTLESNIDQLLDEIPFDAFDLPGYALALFDFGQAHPGLLRLVRWHTLERPGVLDAIPNARDSTLRKVEQMRQAQQAGAIDATLPPADMLNLILALIHSNMESAADDSDNRRRALAYGIRRLTAPATN
jgi:AcrR family transcriptional regulator